MISLARQLAMRREIEEELGELAGAVGRADDERLQIGAKWSGRTDEERAAHAALARRLYAERRRPCECGARRPRMARYCLACSKARAKASAARTYRRKAPTGRCCDCGAGLDTQRSKRCDPCRKRFRHVAARARTQRRLAAKRAAARAALRCCDCGGPIEGARTTQARRCAGCVVAWARVRAAQRQQTHKQRLRAAQQRSAA